MKKLLLAFLLFSTAHASNWDVEYWQYFRKKHFGGDCLNVYLSGEIRLDKDISRFYYYRLTENLALHPFCWLDLEAHYSFIYSKPRGASSFTTRSRIELEANPIVHFSNGVVAILRNRLQIVKRQHLTEPRYVLRERLTIAVPFCIYPFNSIIFYDEVFYNFNLKKFTENRLVPFEIALTFCGIDINGFFMIRNFYRNGDWYNSFVLGTEVGF